MGDQRLDSARDLEGPIESNARTAAPDDPISHAVRENLIRAPQMASTVELDSRLSQTAVFVRAYPNPEIDGVGPNAINGPATPTVFGSGFRPGVTVTADSGVVVTNTIFLRPARRR